MSSWFLLSCSTEYFVKLFVSVHSLPSVFPSKRRQNVFENCSLGWAKDNASSCRRGSRVTKKVLAKVPPGDNKSLKWPFTCKTETRGRQIKGVTHRLGVGLTSLVQPWSSTNFRSKNWKLASTWMETQESQSQNRKILKGIYVKHMNTCFECSVRICTDLDARTRVSYIASFRQP